MKVALLAESFLPHMNGVTHSLLQALRHLERRGHEALVIAPRSGPVDQSLYGARTVLLPSVPLPSYPDVRVVLSGAHRLAGVMRDHGADVLHLASPFVLGRLHRRATLTLAPSTSALDRLGELGVGGDRLRLWRRGVDTERFAPGRRSERWRRRIAPEGEVLVGYVGRLAPEKQVEDLRAIAHLPRTRLVIIGDGPSRPSLERLLPDAHFTGFLGGDALAEAMASLDVFVHPGESETFCQAIQESLASGVPVVATGRGGPLDLVHSSVDGWLYRPGDLVELRDRVRDLVGDDSKRRAFGARARLSVQGRGWDVLGDELIAHYEDAIAMAVSARRRILHVADRAVAPSPSPPAVPSTVVAPPWRRYVAVGDSLTEGLCDGSRMPPGEYRGWADRLAMLLALTAPAGDPVVYANVAVRSRKVADAVDVQLPAATRLGADLVTVLIGANDLVGARADSGRLAASLDAAVARVRDEGADLLLITPFMPRRPASRLFEARFASFADRLGEIARERGAMLLDVRTLGELVDPSVWAEDRVHLGSAGHRVLAYRVAEVLGVRDAGELGALEQAMHDDDAVVRHPGDGEWLARHAVPWLIRRARGRTAGDGLDPKHVALTRVLDDPRLRGVRVG